MRSPCLLPPHFKSHPSPQDSWLRLLQAAASGDRDACVRWSTQVGYLTGAEDEVMVDMSLLPVDVLKKKTRSTRKTWSALGTLYLFRVYLALLEAIVVLYIIYCVDQAFNFGDFELMVDFSELFPQATATVSNSYHSDTVIRTDFHLYRTPRRMLF